MATRKKAQDEQADEAVDDVTPEQAEEEGRADGDITLTVADDGEHESEADTSAEDYVATEDQFGNVVAESFDGEVFSTIDQDVDDPTVTQPTPGGPGDDGVPTRSEKAAVLATVTHPEVTSQNPEPYSVEELNHRFTHIPPEGFVERKFPVKQ